MIYLLGTYEHALVAFIGVLFAFAATCIAIAKLNGYLPKDMGRQYAHDGALSAGKPRGAGIIFVLTFVVSALLFGKMNKEIIIYLVLIVIEMFTGFFDDAAEKPWGEYLKGILDLAVAVVVAISYLHYNSSEITIAITGTTIVIPPVVFAILTVILVWVSINVTNCSDGVDGLSGTLTIITLMSVFVLDNILKVNDSFNAVFVHGDAVDDAMFQGRGAGEFPTASAVVGDVIATARNMQYDCCGRIGCSCYKNLPMQPGGDSRHR